MKKGFSFIAVALALAAMLALAGCSSGATASSSANASTTVASSEKTIEVTLSGGSGRATVESPAKIVEGADGSWTATIVWSSPNYDKMVVAGAEYPPVNKSGNSTFKIPVAALDEEIAVQAETTAMGAPHMIDYTLRFDSSTLS